MAKQNDEVLRAVAEEKSVLNDTDRIALMRKWLLGNGRWDEGLLSRVVILEKKIALILWLLRVVIVAVIGQIIYLFFQH